MSFTLDPYHVATMGVNSNDPMNIATLGWILEVVIPFPGGYGLVERKIPLPKGRWITVRLKFGSQEKFAVHKYNVTERPIQVRVRPLSPAQEGIAIRVLGVALIDSEDKVTIRLAERG